MKHTENIEMLIEKGIYKMQYSKLSEGNILVLTEAFKAKFLDKIQSTIDRNVKATSLYEFNMCIYKLNLSPNTIKAAKILDLITHIVSDTSPYELNKDSLEGVLLDAFTDSDYLKFYEDESSLKPLLNPEVKHFIEDETKRQTALLLKSHYEEITSVVSQPIQPPLNAPKTPQERVSFLWKNNPEVELPTLHRLLVSVKYGFIAPDTTFEQFEAAFTAQPIQSIKPIKWIGTNALLAYFLNKVFEGQNWQSIAGSGLFLNAKDKSLKSNDLAQAKKKNKDWSEPKGHERIDELLIAIKKHS